MWDECAVAPLNFGSSPFFETSLFFIRIFKIRSLCTVPVLKKLLVYMGNLAAFIVAFALVCAGIKAILPVQKVPIVSAKLDWLAEHGDDYDVLFIGSSRTFRQILPEIFDAEMATAGQPVRAFNAGVDGMRPPEDTYMLEKILEGRKKPLRLVVVECNPIRLAQRVEERNTLRAVYWHDNTRMLTLFKASFFSDRKNRSWSKRFEKIADIWPDFSRHFGYWLVQISNIGRGHESLAEWMGVAPPKVVTTSGVGNRLDGYMPFAETGPMNPALTADYEIELAAMLAKKQRRVDGDPVSLAEIKRKQRLIESAGGRMVLLIPPYIGDNFLYPKAEQGFPPVLDFSRPEKYPELFKAEHHSDTGHTNNVGSKIYTHLFTRELLELLTSQTQKK